MKRHWIRLQLRFEAPKDVSHLQLLSVATAKQHDISTIGFQRNMDFCQISISPRPISSDNQSERANHCTTSSLQFFMFTAAACVTILFRPHWHWSRVAEMSTHSVLTSGRRASDHIAAPTTATLANDPQNRKEGHALICLRSARSYRCIGYIRRGSV